MFKDSPVPGDYVSTYDNDSVIYQVIGYAPSDLKKLIIKVIYPRELARQLKEYSVLSLNASKTKFKLLGNPDTNELLRVLYG